MLNKTVIENWIKALKEWDKNPGFRQLRFPMRIESTAGDLYSPTGILCELHSKETGSEWISHHVQDSEITEEIESKKADKKANKASKIQTKKLRGNLSYLGKRNGPPDEVLKWLGVSGGQICSISKENSESGFKGVISFLEKSLSNGVFGGE